MAPSDGGVGLVVVEAGGVGLDYLALAEEEEASLRGWHEGDEGLGFVEEIPEAEDRRGGVDWGIA